jgi:HTH-type transcriptional regulator/antitoxin HipB
VQEFLDSLTAKQADKVIWVLGIVRTWRMVPAQYFKKLVDTNGLWEVRVQYAGDDYRLLGFLMEASWSCCSRGLPRRRRRRRYWRSSSLTSGSGITSAGRTKMDDLDRYIAERATRDPEFAEGYERGFQAFQLGVMLLSARQQAGLTQAEVARRLGTHKSAISRMENHAEDIRLSTLQRYAEAVGCFLSLELRPESDATIPTAVRKVAAESDAQPARRPRRTRATVTAG